MIPPLPITFSDGKRYRFYFVQAELSGLGAVLRVNGRSIGARILALQGEIHDCGIAQAPWAKAAAERPRYVNPATALQIADWIMTHTFKASDIPMRWILRPWLRIGVPRYNCRTWRQVVRSRRIRWFYMAELRRIATFLWIGGVR